MITVRRNLVTRGGEGELFARHDGSGQIRIYLIDTGGTRRTVLSSTTLSNNTRYHIAATSDGEDLRLYVNGVEEDVNTNMNTAVLDDSGPMVIGGQTDYGTPIQFWDDLIDEARMYNHAL